MRFRTILAAAAAPAALAAALLGTAAPAAHAATIQQGSWQLTAPGGSSYQATVQQPVNADGSSVFSAKNRTIPVKWKVTKSQNFQFESVWTGDSKTAPTADTQYSVAHFNMPSGVTVANLTNLTARFAWAYGENHSGGFRWQVEVQSSDPDPDHPGQFLTKNIMVDYGDASTSLQSGTAGSGVNMINSPTADENRDESTQLGGTQYTPWSYVKNNFGSLPVVGIDLVVDGGWGSSQTQQATHDQVINLTDATVGWNSVSSTFTMPAPVTGATVDPSTVPMYVYLSKTAGSTPAAQIDESVITDTQGDSGGQYRTADGMYMYNFPVSNLTDKSASYSIGIMTSSNGTVPFASVGFGIK